MHSKVVILSRDRDEAQRPVFDLAHAMALSPTAVSYWDRDLQCLYANPACADWFGIGPDFLVGSRLQDMLDILRLGGHVAHVDAALQGELRSAVHTFHGGFATREGLVHYIPDARGHLVRGLLLQVGPTPPVARVSRFTC